MSDIRKNTGLVPVDSDPELFKKHIEIQINEKLSLIKALEQRLNDLVNIEAKKLTLQIDVLNKEVVILQNRDAIEA